MSSSLDTLLNTGLTEMGLDLPPEVRERLLAFVALLGKWNKVFNLTAVREPGRMVTHHILDSLAVLPYVTGGRVLDIGSGAGLPGIPLALALPETEFVLLDSNAKKTRFMLQAVGELGLRNVQVVHGRVETYQPEVKFATLLARAFADLGEIVRVAGQLRAPGGEFLLLKGVYPETELAGIPAGFALSDVYELKVPGVEGQRHLVRVVAQ